MILQLNLLVLLLSTTSRDLGVLNDPLKPHLLMNLQCRAVALVYVGNVVLDGDPEKLASHPDRPTNEWTIGPHARSHFNSLKQGLLNVTWQCKVIRTSGWPSKRGAVWNKLKQIYPTRSLPPTLVLHGTTSLQSSN